MYILQDTLRWEAFQTSRPQTAWRGYEQIIVYTLRFNVWLSTRSSDVNANIFESSLSSLHPLSSYLSFRIGALFNDFDA